MRCFCWRSCTLRALHSILLLWLLQPLSWGYKRQGIRNTRFSLCNGHLIAFRFLRTAHWRRHLLNIIDKTHKSLLEADGTALIIAYHLPGKVMPVGSTFIVVRRIMMSLFHRGEVFPKLYQREPERMSNHWLRESVRRWILKMLISFAYHCSSSSWRYNSNKLESIQRKVLWSTCQARRENVLKRF